MKIVFEKVVRKAGSSFATVDKRTRAFDGRFHFHPEIEITLIENGSGRRVVGDSIDAFAPGDLVLLGENLPHQYLSDPAPPDAPAPPAAAKVIQFRADFMGDALPSLPEFADVAALLKRSARGLKFAGATADAAREVIARLFDAAGSKRLLLLLELLDVLSRDASAQPIASAGYLSVISSREGEMIDKALQYLNRNYDQPVALDDLCAYLNVSPATCNRLFQKSIGRSFKAALIETRLSHACRLLLETDQPIVDVAYASGFANLSNFNRHFRELKGQTPREYRRLLRRGRLSPL